MQLQQMTKLTTKVTKKTSLPILSGISLNGKMGQFTDLEVTVTFPYATEFKGVVPLQILRKGLQSKPSEVAITGNPKAGIMTIDGSSLQFKGLPADEFPIVPEGDFQELGTWDLGILAQVATFCSNDDLKPSLMGVRVKSKGGVAELVATDANKLKLAKGVSMGSGDFTAIIPAVNLPWIAKLGECQSAITEGLGILHLRLTFSDLTVYLRLIEEKYPDIHSVIPKGDPNILRFDRAEMLSVVNKALPFTGGTSKGIIDTAKGTLVTADPENDTEYTIDLPEMTGTAEHIAIAYNLYYLQKVLADLTGDEVTWQFSRPTAAAIFSDSKDALTLLMPIRI